MRCSENLNNDYWIPDSEEIFFNNFYFTENIFHIRCANWQTVNPQMKLRTHFQKEFSEAGCDEAGRGCLAGPVLAAAVILPPKFRAKGINDSKQLNAEQRYELRPYIEKHAIAWAVGVVSHSEIDEINIL